MTDILSSTPRENTQDIVLTLKGEKSAKLLGKDSKKLGAWIGEKKAIEKKIPENYKHFLDTMTPKGREVSGKYATRTGMLLVTNDLKPGTPSFETAKEVIVELIKLYKPEVILWRLKDMNPGKYGNMKAEDLVAGLANKSIILPKEFEENVDVLADLDDYEWVGDKSEANHHQTPLAEIVSKVAEAVKTTPPPQVEIPTQPTSTVPRPSPAEDTSKAQAALKQVIKVEATGSVRLEATNSTERLVKSLEEKSAIKKQDVGNFVTDFNKLIDSKFSAKKLESLLDGHVFAGILLTRNAEALSAMTQIIVENNRNAAGKNPNVQSVALRLLEFMSEEVAGNSLFPEKEDILRNMIDLIDVYSQKPTDGLFKRGLTVLGARTEENRLINDNLIDDIVNMTTFPPEKGQTEINPQCLNVFNSDTEASRSFLNKVSVAETVIKSNFYIKMRNKLASLGYEVINEQGKDKLSKRPTQEQVDMRKMIEQSNERRKVLEAMTVTDLLRRASEIPDFENTNRIQFIAESHGRFQEAIVNKLDEEQLKRLSVYGKILVGSAIEKFANRLAELTSQKLAKSPDLEAIKKRENYIRDEIFPSTVAYLRKMNIKVPERFTLDDLTKDLYEQFGVTIPKPSVIRESLIKNEDVPGIGLAEKKPPVDEEQKASIETQKNLGSLQEQLDDTARLIKSLEGRNSAEKNDEKLLRRLNWKKHRLSDLIIKKMPLEVMMIKDYVGKKNRLIMPFERVEDALNVVRVHKYDFRYEEMLKNYYPTKVLDVLKTASEDYTNIINLRDDYKSAIEMADLIVAGERITDSKELPVSSNVFNGLANEAREKKLNMIDLTGKEYKKYVIQFDFLTEDFLGAFNQNDNLANLKILVADYFAIDSNINPSENASKQTKLFYPEVGITAELRKLKRAKHLPNYMTGKQFLAKYKALLQILDEEIHGRVAEENERLR